MSLQPSPLLSVPDETARVAHAAFPKGNPCLRLRDDLGTVFRDDDFADLYPRRGQPTLPPWRLALVTVMQFRENLSDRRAADAVRAAARAVDAARAAAAKAAADADWVDAADADAAAAWADAAVRAADAAACAARAATAAEDTARAAWDTGRAAARAAARSDLQRLIALKLGRPGTLGKPIDPAERGPLGALWPDGAPDWYTHPPTPSDPANPPTVSLED